MSVPLADIARPTIATVRDAFASFVGDDSFPCLAGKGVMNREGCDIKVYGSLESPRSARALARDLVSFAHTPHEHGGLRAFAAVFAGRTPPDEESFERGLWKQLQMLADIGHDSAWDRSVSDDPASPQFSFSVGGVAMFVIGMHPHSSRLARRFQWPTLVFNPRAQFDLLRDDGRFERLRGAIREREINLQGSLNPNLADFGEKSEARQYSGRKTEPDWKCPFHHGSQ